MSVFGEYAHFYNAFYHDKDYEAECDFLERIFARYAQGPISTILDLGCGTGGHALPLARRGYKVTGADLSENMLEKARQKAAEAGLASSFHQADLRTLDLGRTFDAIIAMFAVISYQTTNEDLLAACRTARRHLSPGGLFVFDAWFGPAVLTQRPTARVKIIEQDGERIIRFASPVLDILAQTVQVNYKVLRLRDARVLDEVDESHLMRFIFPQEISHYLQQAGFRLLQLCPFMCLDTQPTDQDWNVTVIAGAV